MRKPRIKRPKKVEVDVGSNILTLKEERSVEEIDGKDIIEFHRSLDYEKPNTLCKITIANIRETRARDKSKKLIGVIQHGFGVEFGYNF